MRRLFKLMAPALLALVAAVTPPATSAANPAANPAATPADANAPLLARIEHVATLPGTGHSWGFAALDPARRLLFLARRENGLTVFDVERQRAVRTLDNSTGANGVVLVPAADRAYATNMDGSVTVVRLSDLTTLQRIAVADANLNSAVYDPRSDRVIIASGRRAARSTLYVLDPRTDRIVASRDFDIRKIDPPLLTGDGGLLLPMRDEGKVLLLAADTLDVRATWTFAGCELPSALAADTQSRHLFVACRGARPVLAVADLDTGVLKTTLPATRAINALAWDAGRKRLLAPSGADASLTIYARIDADHYQALGALATRSWAHNMAYDAERGIAYLFTMDVTQPAASDGSKADPVFHADTFSVLTVTLAPQ